MNTDTILALYDFRTMDDPRALSTRYDSIVFMTVLCRVRVPHRRNQWKDGRENVSNFSS